MKKTKRYWKSRVSDQNGVALLYINLEIHHSSREPSKWKGNKRELKIEAFATLMSFKWLYVVCYNDFSLECALYYKKKVSLYCLGMVIHRFCK